MGVGVSGPLGVLGPLGPLGVSLQFGMTTTPEGSYRTCPPPPTPVPGADANTSCQADDDMMTVRSTLPIRYSHNASEYRQYGLMELYSRQYARGLLAEGGGGGDTSFGVDGSVALAGAERVEDVFYLRTGGEGHQHVQINLIPFGGEMSPPAEGGGGGRGEQVDSSRVRWTDGLDVHLNLSCGPPSSPTLSPIAAAFSHIQPFDPQLPPAKQTQTTLMPFLSARLRPDEQCAVTVVMSVQSQLGGGAGGDWSGYYLFVTGSAVSVCGGGGENASCDPSSDLWGPRVQGDGTSSFNVMGAHQRWLEV